MDNDKRREIIREKILSSEKFEKKDYPYGFGYFFDDFNIQQTLSGEVTVMYKKNPVAYLDKEMFHEMVEEKTLQLSREFFGEEDDSQK